jgi:parvulin-like peptidyl-prolyl isomerase
MANPRERKPVLHTKKHMARLERERRQTRLILGGFIGILVIAAGLLIYGYLEVTVFQARRPVAQIANVAIPVSEWQARVRMERGRLINEVRLYEQYQEFLGVDLSGQQQQLIAQLNSPETLGQSVLESMVDEELIRQETAARGISASAAEIEQAVQASFQYFAAGTPTPSLTPTPVLFPTLSADTLALVTTTPTPTLLVPPTITATVNLQTAAGSSKDGPTITPQATLTPLPTSTPLTEAGYKEAYRNSVDELANQGLSEAQVRQLYETEILRERLLNEIASDVPHEEEQVWARHILVADEAIAAAVRQRLVDGEDFAEVAAKVSTDAGTQEKGGDLGWFGKGAMVPEFEAAAFSLEIGESSQPIKSDFGYHIIQVLAHADVPLDAPAYEGARQAAMTKWLAEARLTYGVETFDTWVGIVPTDPAAPVFPQ